MSAETENTISYKHPTRTTKGVHIRKEPKGFEYNNLDVKAYQEIDIEVPEHVGMWERRFLSRVDVSKSPIERSVVAMVRLKAPDYSASNEKVPPRKEYLYYQERWEGVDFRGIPLNPVAEHMEGVYTKQFTRPHISQETGEIDYYQLDPARAQTIYLIPFSKKAVDDIIAKSANTDKDKGITFTIKFGSQDNPYGNKQMATRNQFDYEMFVSRWEDVLKVNFKPTVQAYQEWVNSEKQKDGLSFKPS